MILIAEDETLTSLVLERFIQKLAYPYTLAYSGKQAVELCLNQSFGLIFMDLTMPELNGLEAIHEIRTHALLNKNTPIFILSGSYPENYKELSEKYTIAGIISKPFLFTHIASCVQDFYSIQ